MGGDQPAGGCASGEVRPSPCRASGGRTRAQTDSETSQKCTGALLRSTRILSDLYGPASGSARAHGLSTKKKGTATSHASHRPKPRSIKLSRRFVLPTYRRFVTAAAIPTFCDGS